MKKLKLIDAIYRWQRTYLRQGFLFSLCLFGLTQPLFAASQTASEAIYAGLQRLVPGLTEDQVQIRETPTKTLYEVIVGGQLLYFTADGNYFLKGSLFSVSTRENLTEMAEAEIRLKAIAAIPDDQMIIFSPKEYQHTITIFTDIDCGYCRKLHREIKDYLAEGIRIRYLFFPRAGVGSPSYEKAVSVWCADDRNAAMTMAKNGETIETKQCENPVDRHLELAKQLGLRGTPALILEDGQMLPGYIPASRLAAHFKEQQD